MRIKHTHSRCNGVGVEEMVSGVNGECRRRRCSVGIIHTRTARVSIRYNIRAKK